MKKRSISTFIMFVLMIIALASFFCLWYLNKDMHSQITKTLVLRNEVVTDYKPDKIKINKANDVEAKTLTFIDKYLLRKVDHAALLRKNKDYDQWLYYPESTFDFPVVMEPEVGKYHYDMLDFNQKWTGTGNPLIPKSPNETDFRTLILAHRMVNYWKPEDYLFSHLPDRWLTASLAKQHPYVYTYKGDKAYRWKVWTGLAVRGDDMIYQTPYLKNTKEYQELIDHVAEIAPYTIDKKPSAFTPLLMLSTCSMASDPVNIGRYCVVFKLDMIYDQKAQSLVYQDDEDRLEQWKLENEKERLGSSFDGTSKDSQVNDQVA